MRMAVVALSSTLLGPAASAYAEETWNFDPAACHSGAPDKMYIAFRRNVLAIPATTNPFIGGSLIPAAGDRPLTPPSPDEPVGCFGNPRQLRDFGSPQDLMLCIPCTPSAVIGDWPGEKLQRQIARTSCERTDLHDEMPPGFMSCRTRSSEFPNNPDLWAVTYIAHDDFYQTPLGHPFVVNCGPSRLRQCDVSYTYSHGLNLAFRYEFLDAKPDAAILDVLASDKAARKRIADELIPDYPWPTPDEDGAAPRQ